MGSKRQLLFSRESITMASVIIPILKILSIAFSQLDQICNCSAMSRKIIMLTSLFILFRRTILHLKACVRNQQAIGKAQSMAVYTVSEIYRLLRNMPKGQKISCFVRGLIFSDHFLEDMLTKTKKVICSTILKTQIFSSRPKIIIDALDLTDKQVIRGPIYAKNIKLQDIVTGETADLISNASKKLSIIRAFTEISREQQPLRTTILKSIQSFLSKLFQPFILINRIFRGAPIKDVLIELGILNKSHMLILGDCSINSNGVLQIQAQMATKDKQLYLKDLSKRSFKNIASFVITILTLWMFVVFFSRQIQELTNSIRNWFMTMREPQEIAEDSEQQLFGCYICESSIRSIIFKPCKHFGVCKVCYEYLENKQCPTCKADIEGIIQVQKCKK